MQFAPPPVVGLQYCYTYSVDIAISRKGMTLSDGNFVVADNNANPIFKVKGALFTLHGRRRWQAFRGHSSDMRDLVFTAPTGSVI
ncbi:hypothetical protein NL676_018703 [Syzygium grande]|nr:hypothetical protein NL676_018703 [Syzygium grande]